MVGQLGLEVVIKIINFYTRDIWKGDAFYLLTSLLNPPNENTPYVSKIKLKM